MKNKLFMTRQEIEELDHGKYVLIVLAWNILAIGSLVLFSPANIAVRALSIVCFCQGMRMLFIKINSQDKKESRQ